MDVTLRAREVIASVLNVDMAAVDRGSSADTIAGWDSLRHVQLVLALEESFGIQFEVEDIESMSTVGAVVDAVQRRLAQE